MLSLSKNQNIALIFVLSAIMWFTRGHHFASLSQLPDASWAIFFIAGFYFSSFAVIALFLAQAFLIDYLAFTQLGIAYPFLLPAYLSLWLAGRWLAKNASINITSFKNFLLASVVGTIVCELISSGSFYLINVPGQASLTEFAGRIVEYLPYALEITLGYLLVALVSHLVIISIASRVVAVNKIK
jgi:hypothetical protein